MYRIVKRIVHIVTTTTWLVRWEKGPAEQDFVEQEIVLPASHSRTETVIHDSTSMPAEIQNRTDPVVDEGDKQ